MIRSQDRSGWFGASDTAAIMGSWDTKTFASFWLVKLGLARNTFRTTAMITGTMLEHRILDALEVPRRDRQIRIRPLRLRVNLDGEVPERIVEVKTYRDKPEFRVSKVYWRQCQVEMFAAGKPCCIAAYRVSEEDDRNLFLPIDMDRISIHPIARDEEWIEQEYLPRLRYLAECLRKERFPRIEDYRSRL